MATLQKFGLKVKSACCFFNSRIKVWKVKMSSSGLFVKSPSDFARKKITSQSGDEPSSAIKKNWVPYYAIYLAVCVGFGEARAVVVYFIHISFFLLAPRSTKTTPRGGEQRVIVSVEIKIVSQSDHPCKTSHWLVIYREGHRACTGGN